jgi:hypothetical protein
MKSAAGDKSHFLLPLKLRRATRRSVPAIVDLPVIDPLEGIVAAIGSGINAVISSPAGQRVLGGLGVVGGVAEGVASAAV